MEMEIFKKQIWEMGVDHPEQRKAIAKVVTNLSEYDIPIRKYSPLTEELEDITITLPAEIEDPKVKERVMASLELTQALTVRDLAIRLGILHQAYRIKEAKGEELTPQEKTLKDLDITALAFTLQFMRVPKEAYKKYEASAEGVAQFEADRKKLIDRVEEERQKRIAEHKEEWKKERAEHEADRKRILEKIEKDKEKK